MFGASNVKSGDAFFLKGGAVDLYRRVIISDPATDPDRVMFR
jgi:hypothetical protein